MDRQSVKFGAVPKSLVCTFAGCWVILGTLLFGHPSFADEAPAAGAAVDAAKADAAKPDTPKPDAQKYKLAYLFVPGQEVHFKVKNASKIHIQRNGVEEIVENSSETDRHFKVMAVAPGGNGDLELSIDRVHMSARFNDGAEEIFKSDDPKFHHPKFKQVLASVGKPQAVISFSPTGRVVNVKANQGAVAQAAKADDDAHETYLSPLPEEPIAIGTGWKEEFELRVTQERLSVKIRMTRRYTLADVKDGVALINFSTYVITPVNDPAIEAQLIQRKTKGQLQFDIAQGMVIARIVAVPRDSIIEPFGAKSSMSAESTYEERLIPAKVAGKSTETAAK